MALDTGLPTQVQTPNPMATLGNMLGTAQAAQQYQAGAMALQSQTQANQERQNLIKLFQTSPNAKALPDGTLNPALYGEVLNVAPQTGLEMIQKIAINNSDVTAANKSQFNLGQEQNTQIAQVLQDNRNKPKSNAVGALDNLQEQFPGMAPRIAIAKKQLAGVDDTDQAGVDAVLNHTMAITQTLAQRKEYTQPDYAVIPTGLKGLQVQRNPEAPGGVVSPTAAAAPGQPSVPMTLGPGDIEHLEIDPVSKQNVIVRRSPEGKIISARPASGLPTGTGGPAPAGTPGAPGAAPPPAFTPVPQGETVETLGQLQSMRAASNAAAMKTGESTSNNKQILSLLASGTTTGTNAPAIQKWMGSVGLQWTGDEATNLGRISHFLALQQQTNEKTMGVNTDAGREVSGLVSGGIKLTTEALKSATKANDALTTGTKVFNIGLENAIAKGGIGAARPFQNAWAQNFDPTVYRYANAKRDGDNAEMLRIRMQLKAPPKDQKVDPQSAWGQFIAKAQALHALEGQ